MFELTGALGYILPTMITVLVTKAVGDYFYQGGITEQLIWFNGLPFQDKEEHIQHDIVKVLMVPNPQVLVLQNLTMSSIGQLLLSGHTSYPVVDNAIDMRLEGIVSAKHLQAIHQVQDLQIDRAVLWVRAKDRIDVAEKIFAQLGPRILVVVQGQEQVVGVLARKEFNMARRKNCWP